MQHFLTVIVWSVCLLVTSMSTTKTTKPIEVPFGLWTWVVPRNHVLGGGLDLEEQGQFRRFLAH